MMKSLQDLNIAVLAGGPGSERRVSLASGNAVLEALRGHCRSVQLVDLETAKVTLPEGIDLAFNAIHGTYGEDGVLQEQLEALGVPYTGAGIASSRLAFDKLQSKARFVAAGVITPEYRILPVADAAESPLPYPCVVKPPKEGSSVGVHIVHGPDQWAAAVADAAKYGDTLLVEEFIKGKELTVGILNGEALPIIHIQPRSGFYDMSNKYPWMNNTGGTDYFCPAELPAEVTAGVQRESVKAHEVLGVEIYSRVDLVLDEQNRYFVLEVNTIPGMTSSSLLPKAARAVGIEFPELCVRIAEASLQLRQP